MNIERLLDICDLNSSASAPWYFEMKSALIELKELRAYKEAVESQEPVGFVYEDDSWCGGGEIHAQVDVDLPSGTKLYANPVPADKPAVSVPDCFVKLYKHARGMRFGTDWNNGTAARHNRQPLINATWECEKWLSATPSHSQQSVSTDHAGRPMTYWGGLADRCPSHDSEQGGEV